MIPAEPLGAVRRTTADCYADCLGILAAWAASR